MTLKFTLAADAPEAAAAPAIVVGIYEDRALSPAAARVDERSGGALKRLIEGGDATGKPVRLIGTSVDITRRKDLEAALRTHSASGP